MKRILSISIATMLALSFPAVVTGQNLFASAGTHTQIYEFTPGGAYSTFATVPSAAGLAFNGAGDLFVSTGGLGTILQIRPNGTQSTFASGLKTPEALALDNAGDVFVEDITASAIYKFTPDGVRSTFASGVYDPGMTVDRKGNLFVVGLGVIYEFTPNGASSIFASVPGEGLRGLAFNSAGDLFVAAGGDAGYIYEFTPNGEQSTFASGLSNPQYLAFNSVDELFVSEFTGGTHIDKFTPDGMRSAFDSSVSVDALAFEPVPEPSVWATLGMGGLVLFGLRCKAHRR